AGRQLLRNPGFATVAVLTLALGIGANTAIFSVVNGVLLRPIPFANADRLAVVWETDRNSGTSREPASWPDYVDFRDRTRTLAGAEAATGADISLAPEQGEPARIAAMAVTHGFFGLLGVSPLAGRGFTAEEDRPGSERVALLGEAIWRARYHGDRAIIGKKIRLNDEPHVVIGIIPAGADFGLDQIHARAAYHGPYAGIGDVDAWVTLRATAESYPRDTHPIFIVGRLAPGATVETAQQELASIAADLERSYASNKARSVNVESLAQVVFGPTRPVLVMLLAAVALVLVVACVNVANLLLARGTARLREVAVRGALGARFGRLSRQFVVEALLLSLLGAAAGVAVAFGGLKLLLALAPADIPRLREVGIDARVLGVTFAMSLVVGIVFGMVPTVQAFRIDVMRIIKGESPAGSRGRGGRRFREALVVTELALSVTLVVCAGLLIRSFRTVLEVDPGFRAEGVLKAEYQLPTTRYPRNFAVWPHWTEIHRFNAELLDRVRSIPGVESAAIAGAHPLDAGFTNSFAVVGREAEGRNWPEISVRLVSPGYFTTLGVRRVSGRVLEPADDGKAPLVAVINEAAAKRFFPTQDPIGHEIRFWGTPRRIVGVVGDERFRGLTEPAAPGVYAALAQAPSSSGVLLVRTAGDPTLLARAVREAIWSGDRELAIYGVEPLSETLLESIGQRRFAMMVLGAFAAVTLVLALIGIHGVLSYATSQRTREIGIRIALGATRGEVSGLVMRGGLTLAALGTGFGLLGAAAGSKLLAGLLFGVGRGDPGTFVVAAVAALAAAALATWLPARRAGSITPTEALRAE
ncbi:MAG: ABC transporter permease, partial [Gemmatimonadota bacterium]